MKRYLPHCSLILLLLAAGCAQTASITVKNEVNLRCAPVLTVRPGEDEKSCTGLTRYDTQRFFCTAGSNRINTAILEKGSSEALSGNLPGAETIFTELKDREKNGGVENNLAIIYELNGNNTRAFEMYTYALQMDPDNILFRKNLYFFLSDRGIRNESKTEKKRKQTDAQR